MSNIFKNNLLKILIILLTISSSSYALKKGYKNSNGK